jgi:hypothetical protein
MKFVLSLVVIVVIVLVGMYLLDSKQSGDSTQLGSVGGLQSTVATSSTRGTTAATVQLLFATSTSCSSRIIGTQLGAVNLTMSDHRGLRPTVSSGLRHATSTTIAYDAELYGCGAVYVYPYTADTLTLVETL